MTSQIKVGDGERSYFNGTIHKLETESSTLISSSKYLNHAPLRALIAQEMLRRNGADVPNTAYIPEVGEILTMLEDWMRIGQLFEEEKARLPLFREWLEKRSLADFKREDVEHCAPGTLGAALYDFMVNSGYDMDIYYRELEVTSDLTYYFRQTALTHDIEHIVTGFYTNHGGEVALLTANLHAKARYFHPELAAFMSRIQTYLKAKTIMKDGLHYPEGYVVNLEAEYQGAVQGRNWKYPLLLAPWREWIDRQVSDIQEELGITPVPEPGLFGGSEKLVEDAPNVPLMQAAE